MKCPACRGTGIEIVRQYPADGSIIECCGTCRWCSGSGILSDDYLSKEDKHQSDKGVDDETNNA